MKITKKPRLTELFWTYLKKSEVTKASMLLKTGFVSIKKRNSINQTPLQWAAAEGTFEVFNWLISKGAKDNLIPAGKAFFNCCFEDRPDYAKILLSTPNCIKDLESIFSENHDNVYHAAFYLENEDILKFLFENIPLEKSFLLLNGRNERGKRPIDIRKSKINHFLNKFIKF